MDHKSSVAINSMEIVFLGSIQMGVSVVIYIPLIL